MSNSVKLRLALCLLCVDCVRKSPAWLPEIREVVAHINTSLKNTLAKLEPERPLTEVREGLSELEKIIDYIDQNQEALRKKYPQLPTETKLVEQHLGPQFQEMRKNMRLAATAFEYWRRQKGLDEGMKQSLLTIRKKFQNINQRTR